MSFSAKKGKYMNKEIQNFTQKTEIRSLESLIVPNGTPIVLNDIAKSQLRPGVRMEDFDAAANMLFVSSFLRLPIYVTAQQLALPMQGLLKDAMRNLDSKTTAVLFPGNGSWTLYEDVWKTLPKLQADVYKGQDLEIKRVFENGKAQSMQIAFSKYLRDGFDWDKYRKILIVDDVIATGKTLSLIQKELPMGASGQYEYQAISWFCRSDASAPGYKKISSVIDYSSLEGYPALNSLSTLLSPTSKGEAVREGYTKKYIRYPYGFRKEIENLQKLTTIGDVL
jgi:hypoxanthine phosphoribosyltransferase